MNRTYTTSLPQKLGIMPDRKICILHGAPEGLLSQIRTTYPAIEIHQALNSQFDYIHLFVTRQLDLEMLFHKLLNHLKAGGCIWISWPKQRSRVKTDVNENTIREVGLSLGIVDIKVCAIDDIWSGLQFVRRKK